MAIAICPYCRKEMNVEDENVYQCKTCTLSYKFVECCKPKHIIDIERQEEIEDTD